MNAVMEDLIAVAVEDEARAFARRNTFAERHGAALMRGVRRRRAVRGAATGTASVAAVGSLAWGATAMSWPPAFMVGSPGVCGGSAVAVTQEPEPAEVHNLYNVVTVVTDADNGQTLSWSVHLGDVPFFIDGTDGGEAMSAVEADELAQIEIEYGADHSVKSVVALGPDGTPLDAGSWSYETVDNTVTVTVKNGDLGMVTTLTRGEPDVMEVSAQQIEGLETREPTVVCVTPEPSVSPSPAPSVMPSASPSPQPSPSPGPIIESLVPSPAPSPSQVAAAED